MRLFAIVVALFTSSWSGAEEGYHFFSDVFGQKTEARIVKVENEQVYLEERDGGKLSLSLKSLPEEEQKVVKEWVSRSARKIAAAPTDNRSKAQVPFAGEQKKPVEMSRIEMAVFFAEDKRLLDKCEKLRKAGRFDEALSVAKEHLTLFEEKLGPEHPQTLLPLQLLTLIHMQMGQAENVVASQERSLEIAVKAYGEDDQRARQLIAALGHSYRVLGRYELAEKIYLKDLQNHLIEFGKDDPSTAGTMISLGGLYVLMGRYEESERLYLRARRIYESTFGPDHPKIGYLMGSIGDLNQKLGRYEEAESCFLRSLRVSEKTADPESTMGIRSIEEALTQLAALYSEIGRLGEAEPLYRRSAELLEKALGADHLYTGESWVNLGNLYLRARQFTESEMLYRKALRIAESKGNDGRRLYLRGLGALGELFRRSRRWSEAEPMLRRALRQKEELLGPDNPSTLMTANNLAAVLVELERYEEAELLYKRVLQTRRSQLGDNHADTARSITNLGTLYWWSGRFEEAEPLLEQAVAIYEKEMGLADPGTSFALGSLAGLKFDINDRGEALRFARLEFGSIREQLRNFLTFTSEVERLNYRTDISPMDYFASFGSASDVADAVVQMKGVILESVLEDRRIVRAAESARLTSLLDEIQSGKARVRRLQLTGGESRSGKAEVAKLEEKVRDREKELARNVSGLGKARESLTLLAIDVASVLPGKTALVEYFQYYQLLGKGKFEVSYGAIVIRPESEPALVFCGKVEELDGAAEQFRNAVRNVDQDSLEEAARSLHRSLIEPLTLHLDGVDTLIVSPDGQLNFISFATLMSESRQFLSEDYDIYHVAGGRDLLKKTTVESKGLAILVGGPAFRDVGGESARNETTIGPLGFYLQRGMGEDIKNINLESLPASGKEASRVARALGDAGPAQHILTGTEATEVALRGIKAPKILHLATHGFFLSAIGVSDRGRSLMISDSEVSDAQALSGGLQDPVENPMYRSGIALAGAQTTIEKWRRGEVPDPDNDGILMAAEVIDLDLRGTDLVTLSACSTATGEVLSGEGVLGLRRGFVMAGARNLLMTLWPVADEETADFMEDFYTRYAKSGNAPKSLAEVQREWLVRLRKEKGLVHAVNRAGPFIMSSQGRLD